MSIVIPALNIRIVPVSFAQAKEFVRQHHRHNKPPVGHKFSIGVAVGPLLVGVAMVGRPIARAFDNGVTLEVNRTCTIGCRNANSMLYGAAWKAAKAMGYRRLVTYTQHQESGASLRACGWTKVKELPARGSWYESSGDANKPGRDQIGNGGVERVLWEIKSECAE